MVDTLHNLRRLVFVIIAIVGAAMTVLLAGRISGAAQPSLVVTPAPSDGSYHDGQSVSVSIGPNTLFTPNAKVNILECADPGGTSANLPKDVSSCDGNTIQGDTILIQSDGSFSEGAYDLHALPSHALGEQANKQPVCDTTNPCVLYVGENQEDFTQPKVFSVPFRMSASTSSSSTAATSATTTTSPTVASTSASSTARGGTTPVADPSASLANTGPSPLLPWLFGAGLLFAGVGAAPAPSGPGCPMTIAPPTPQATTMFDDVPMFPRSAPTLADRLFRSILMASSAVVLLLLAATTGFLVVKGWPGFQKGGIQFFTGQFWSPDTGRFGALALLAGSWAIALVGLIVAVPISLAMALLITEYSPPSVRPYLTSLVDVLATVPSIVYGLWGYELFSNWQVGPAHWLVHNFAFIPVLRTPTLGNYGLSILATGLVVSLTIIPIVTSVIREVMGQVPRDACEAALGLGGTRWGMITDVILPFSRNGIVGASLLGLGRGLGETMIPVLVLSTANKLTSGLLGPGGLGSIAKQITQDFETGSPIAKASLIVAGFVLFLTTLAVTSLARGIVRRAGFRAR